MESRKNTSRKCVPDGLYLVICGVHGRRISNSRVQKVCHHQSMLTSELAKELGVDPSVVSKTRTYYREESKLPTQSELEGEELRVIRLAHQIKVDGKGITYRQAIRQALGLTTHGLTAEQVSNLEIQVGKLEIRMHELEKTVASQNALLLGISSGVDRLVTHLRFYEAQSDDQVSKGQLEPEQAASLPPISEPEEAEQLPDDQVLEAQSKPEQTASLLPMTGLEEAGAAAGEGVDLRQVDAGQEATQREWKGLETFEHR